jgi:hypothetical protein
LPTTSHQRNAAHWLKVKQDEDRLAHYRARRNHNQRNRRARLLRAQGQQAVSEPPGLSDADVISNWLESPMANPEPE